MNMGIVSMSIPDELILDMDSAIAGGQYRGRSEFMRVAIRELLQSKHVALDTHMHGSITVTYGHDHSAKISDVRHAFHDVVLSLMHTHCEKETCMDVLIVGGDVGRIQELQEALARIREVKRSHLALVP